jgi:hypothetical protein
MGKRCDFLHSLQQQEKQPPAQRGRNEVAQGTKETSLPTFYDFFVR